MQPVDPHGSNVTETSTTLAHAQTIREPSLFLVMEQDQLLKSFSLDLKCLEKSQIKLSMSSLPLV